MSVKRFFFTGSFASFLFISCSVLSGKQNKQATIDTFTGTSECDNLITAAFNIPSDTSCKLMKCTLSLSRVVSTAPAYYKLLWIYGMTKNDGIIVPGEEKTFIREGKWMPGYGTSYTTHPAIIHLTREVSNRVSLFTGD
jgi:hypothetical protein